MPAVLDTQPSILLLETASLSGALHLQPPLGTWVVRCQLCSQCIGIALKSPGVLGGLSGPRNDTDTQFGRLPSSPTSSDFCIAPLSGSKWEWNHLASLLSGLFPALHIPSLSPPVLPSSSFCMSQSPARQGLPPTVYLLRPRCHPSAQPPCETRVSLPEQQSCWAFLVRDVAQPSTPFPTVPGLD